MLTYLLRLVLVLPLVLGCAAWAGDTDSPALAITANGAPVMKLYRDRDGGARYQLADDLALGISLGLSPVQLSPGAPGRTINSRWLPIFDLYRAPDTHSYLLPDQSIRESRQRQWFWTVGTNTDAAADAFDFQGDFVQHFSLQTKAGFLIPLGRRWLLGGALTFDHAAGPDTWDPTAPHASGSSLGAFLGIEFSY